MTSGDGRETLISVNPQPWHARGHVKTKYVNLSPPYADQGVIRASIEGDRDDKSGLVLFSAFWNRGTGGDGLINLGPVKKSGYGSASDNDKNATTDWMWWSGRRFSLQISHYMFCVSKYDSNESLIESLKTYSLEGPEADVIKYELKSRGCELKSVLHYSEPHVIPHRQHPGEIPTGSYGRESSHVPEWVCPPVEEGQGE